MHVRPIISTLGRHKTAATLIVLEIALTCAIVCNALFLVHERIARIERPSGCVEDELVRIGLTGIGTKTDANVLTTQDLAALRAIPGVKQVASTNMVPYGNSSWNNDISTIKDDPNGTNAASYMGRDLLETLGARLIAGRAFTPNEYVDLEAVEAKTAHVPSIILSRSLAVHLFGTADVVGKPVYATGEEPQIVVGVIEDLMRPNDFGHPEEGYYSMVAPVQLPYTVAGTYALRVDPNRRDEILAEAVVTLDRVDPARIILKQQTIEQMRHDYYNKDRAMTYLLLGVSLALLVITALGIVGLASFWVQQRTRQIGIRRALGATRGHIVRYFQLENFILATLGIVLGMALAYGINLVLMAKYAVPRLPGEFLPIGAVLLWLLGQLAVLGPAMRASTIAPAVATRTV
ncbi:MAG TPA: FtsX-like permease family protein [Kofleriaceae bacterium]|nr:FtsX-like permease family protein [Kofleriaceae bacterium]